MNLPALIPHLFASLPPWTAVAAGSLIASVWQGILLAAAVALSLRVLPRFTAAARSWIWTSVLLVVLVLPLLSLRSTGMHIASATHPGVLRLSESWSLALAGLWAALSLFRTVQLLISAFRLRALSRRATPVKASDAILGLLTADGRRAELCLSGEVDRPSVAGFFRPRILLPPDLLHKLSTAELEQVVLHEMEHLRRRDDWTNLLQKLALAVLPLNPVLLWLDRQLCLERELACDDGVMRATQARKAYAACLASLAEDSLVRRGVLLALGFAGRRQSELARRVYRILARPEVVMGRCQMRFAAGALLAGVAVCTVALARSPRLVSFGPAPAGVVQTAAVTSSVSSGALVHSVSSPSIPSRAIVMAHPRLVNAAMNSRTMPKTIPAVSRNVQRTVALKRARQTVAPQAAPIFVYTEWHFEATPPQFMTAEFHEAHSVQLHDSQFTYAAVPVRGGWLIVQL